MNETDSNAATTAEAPRSNAPLALLILLFIFVGVVVAGVRNVPGGEVGVIVNNLTRSVSLADRVGLHFTIPYVTSFYSIDRKARQFDMLSNANIPAEAVERPPDDSLSVKSKEGDSVKIDVKVQYQILPEMAVEVLRSSGNNLLEYMKAEAAKSAPQKWRRFEHVWIWPIVRASLADRFNELTREEMNDGPKRADKAETARTDANRILKEKYGIEVRLITVENPSSYTNYELIVRQRKDIEQQVLAIVEEQKQETEAQLKQIEVETQNNVKELSAANANNLVLLKEAEARKDKEIRAAESDALMKKASADARLAKDLAEADGIRKRGEAEAEGLRQLAAGLSGPEGLAVIASEVAKRLQTMTITAQPFIYNGLVQPYLMQQGQNLIPNPNVRIDGGVPLNPQGGSR